MTVVTETELGVAAGGSVNVGDLIRSFRDVTPDGKHLLLLDGGKIDRVRYPELSALFGANPSLYIHPGHLATWGSSSAPYRTMCQSADGEYAFVYDYAVVKRYKKADGTYAQVLDTSLGNGYRIACSEDGRYVLVAGGNHSEPYRTDIYISDDYGETFIKKKSQNHSYEGSKYGGSWVSKNGQNMVFACHQYSYKRGTMVFISENYGQTWRTFSYLDTDIDYKRVSADEDLGRIFVGDWVSTDKGATFNAMTGTPGTSVTWVAIDATNPLLMMVRCGVNHDPYLSEDGGITWAPLRFPDYVSATSAGNLENGKIVVKASRHDLDGGFTLISADLGQTWSCSHSLSGEFKVSDAPGKDVYVLESTKLTSMEYGDFSVMPIVNEPLLKVVADKVE